MSAKILYRYEYMLPYTEGNKEPAIKLQEYRVITETLCGYWIWPKHKKKWVSNNGKNRFAYPNKKDALYHAFRRTSYRLSVLKCHIEICNEFLQMLEEEETK